MGEDVLLHASDVHPLNQLFGTEIHHWRRPFRSFIQTHPRSLQASATRATLTR